MVIINQLCILIISIVISDLVLCDHTRYDNYKLYSVQPKSDQQVDILNTIELNSDSFIFIEHPKVIDREALIVVPPHKLSDFTTFLEQNELKYKVIDHNIQLDIDEEYNRQLKRSGSEFNWMEYYRLQKMYDWMQKLVEDNSAIASLIDIGESYEGRKILGIKISYKAGNPGIFIEGGIHAREWITPAVNTYLINELITSDVKSVRKIAENYDWYIVPVVNPDGYEFSHTNDRLWRKTRSPQSDMCFGVDPNRNWDNHWMENGTSNITCRPTYGGPYPFSENETKALSDYLLQLKGKIQTYLAFHSYSQVLLFPYGFTKDKVANYDDLYQIGTATAKGLINRYGTEYTVGSIVDVMYPVSGSSMEWVYDNLDVKLTFTYELRPSRNSSGRKGFVLPPDQIIPTGEEVLDSLVALLDSARSLGYSYA